MAKEFDMDTSVPPIIAEIIYGKGYRDGFEDCLREMKETMHKLYGNSMQTLKGREDGNN